MERLKNGTMPVCLLLDTLIVWMPDKGCVFKSDTLIKLLSIYLSEVKDDN